MREIEPVRFRVIRLPNKRHCSRQRFRACERRPGDHGLRLPPPGGVAAGVVDGGDDDDDHGARRDDRRARGGHGVRCAGAGDERRGYERLGHEVAILVEGSKPAGDHTVRFGAGCALRVRLGRS